MERAWQCQVEHDHPAQTTERTSAASDRPAARLQAGADPRAEAQRRLIDCVQGSPRMAAQRAQIQHTMGDGVVQRIVRLGGSQVPPQYHDELVARVRTHFETAGADFLPAHEAVLRGWATEHGHVVASPSIAALAVNLAQRPGDHANWTDGMTRTAISDSDMQAAKAMRSRERFARVMEPSKTSTTSRVSGLGKLKDTDLLRLQDHGIEEEQYWMRPDGVDDEQLDTVKRKGISGQDEAHITACGNPDDPSYVVALNNRHLGHRYVGSGRQTGTGNERTYGSKKDREGYEYKGSGLVDGHAIQVQDDQQILGPFQEDAADWQTRIPKTDGTSVTYQDYPYLPKDEHDTRMIETHPHNFYWENQGQGQRMRQKAIEASAMKSGASFLHYNVFAGETFHPNDGKATDHTYSLASRVHYLHTEADGSQSHLSCDNRAVADYSNHAGYDATTRQYPDIPSGVPQKGENSSLGGLSAFDHRKLAQMPDTTAYPYSTVLRPADPGFSFRPDHRTQVSGYETPPSSPYWAPDELVDDERIEAGDHRRLRHFHDQKDGALIVDAKYDEAKKQTTLGRKKRKVEEPANWPEGGDEFEQLLAGRGSSKKTKLSTIEELDAEFDAFDDDEEEAEVDIVVDEPAGDVLPSSSTTVSGAIQAPALPREEHQRRIHRLAGTLAELQVSLDASWAEAHAALQVLIDQLGQVDAENPAEAAVVGAVYVQAVAWFRDNARGLYRATADRHPGEPGGDRLGISGQRLASLRQYFSECAQMAVHNVLSLAGAADDEFDERLLDQHGGFVQNEGEDAIRTMLQTAGQRDLPVIGNLGDLQGMLQNVDDFGDDAAKFYNLSDAEQAGHDSIRIFGVGLMDELNLVLNTEADNRAPGTHWIAVRLNRQPDGQVAVTYLDSYDEANDYSQLFDGLRAFFGAVRPNVPTPQGAHPVLGKPKRRDDSTASSPVDGGTNPSLDSVADGP